MNVKRKIKEAAEGCKIEWQQRPWQMLTDAQARKLGTTAPRIPCTAAGQSVSLLGNVYKQDGDLRGKSLEMERGQFPAEFGCFSCCSPGDTVAHRKRTSEAMAYFSHGTEIKRDFQKRLLLPPPPAHPPLSRGRSGARRAAGGRRIRRVTGVRNAEFGGVPPSPPNSPPQSRAPSSRPAWLPQWQLASAVPWVQSTPFRPKDKGFSSLLISFPQIPGVLPSCLGGGGKKPSKYLLSFHGWV